MTEINITNYSAIAEDLATAVDKITGLSQLYYDAAYEIVTLEVFDPEIDLLIPFHSAYLAADAGFIVPATGVNAVFQLQKHILARAVDASGNKYANIDAWLSDKGITVPQEFADLSDLAGFPIAAENITGPPEIIPEEPVYNYSMLFENSKSEHIIIDDPVYSSSDYSISAWIKALSFGSPGYNFYAESHTDSSTSSLELAASTGGKVRITIYSDVGDPELNNISTSTALGDNLWHQIVWADKTSNNTAVLYIDGFADTTNFDYTPNIPITNISRSTIGAIRQAIADKFFDGNIDEVSTWNIALSADDVTELYNAGVPTDLNAHTKSANLTHWWRMGENATFDGSDWTIPDEIGSSDGTSVNLTEEDRVTDVPT